MPVPHSSANFGDLLDPRVKKIFYGELEELPDYVGTLYAIESSSTPYEISSEVGELDDFTEFTGTVTYGSQNQGYDVRATHLEFSKGIQVERKLFDDDQHGIINKKPIGLATSYNRTRQKH